MAFADVVGHERQKALLTRSLDETRLPPALLFVGPEGVGKRRLALALGRLLLCEGEPRPCGTCRHCHLILKALFELPERRLAALEEPDEPTGLDHRLHPDLFLIEPWRSANRPALKIEQVRDLTREVASPPFEARARLFVLDDAHAMTEPAMNALLKSLEEPPPTSHLVLVTSAPQALLPTIRSRCQTLRFDRLGTEELARHLVAAQGLGLVEARLLAVLADGSMGAALAFESDEYRSLREELLTLLEACGTDREDARLDAAERLAESEDVALALNTLRGLLRDVVALTTSPLAPVLNLDRRERLLALAQGPLGARALAVAEAAAETRTAMVRGNAHKLLFFDLLFESLGTR